MKHVAVLPSPHPRANILGIDTSAAMALPGVHYVLTGDELAAETNSLFHGLDLPNVIWHPLAVGMTRYAGEWVAAVVADSRYIAEDAAELIEVDYRSLPAAVDSEKMIDGDQPLVHPDHGSNVLFRKTWEWGPVEEDFKAMPHTVSYRARWGGRRPCQSKRSAWSPNGTRLLKLWMCGPRSRCRSTRIRSLPPWGCP